MLEKNALSTELNSSFSKLTTVNNLIANVYVFLPFREYFDYIIPEQALERELIGCRVLVPFGSRRILGVIIKTTHSSEVQHHKLKEITEILDTNPLFGATLRKLIHYFAQYYFYYPGEVYHACLSPHLKEGKYLKANETAYWALTKAGNELDYEAIKRATKQKDFIIKLKQQEKIACGDLNIKEYASSIKALQKKGLIDKIFLTHLDKTINKNIITPNIILNQEQVAAIDKISSNLHEFTVFLLFGITGSGKTEVYLNCCIKALISNKQVLIMVPEIGLTPQTISRYQDRFHGYNIVSWHSHQTPKEKNTAWNDIFNGDADIIIGTRSAIWLPYKQLGLIIIDEEHDISFKQQEGFLYNARDVAITRAKIENFPIILGSATPSIETLNNVKINKYNKILLTQRANQIPQQEIKIIDIRHNQLKAGINYDLIEIIRSKVENKEQVLIFLNRRGFAPAIYCNSCRWIEQCKFCKVNLIYHKDNNRLICHHCFYKKDMPEVCPSCNSYNIFPVGVGTEQIEIELKKLLPKVNIARIDKDTSSTNKKLVSILQGISNNEIDIIIGTQMIAKGHDFANLSLAIIIDIDQAFFSSDFRALEKAAQLITQVSGRVGRGDKPGLVYLQTNQPENDFFNYLKKLDYQITGDMLLTERLAAYLPPKTYHALLNANSKDYSKLKQFMFAVKNKLDSITKSQGGISILGPTNSPIAKIRNRHRQQILIQSHSRKELHDALSIFVSNFSNSQRLRDIRWNIDVDPLDFC